jgi:exodeoxyribonuclease VII small subunit
MNENDVPFRAGPEPGGYKEALDELEGILSELEDDDIDVDMLATRVKRAAELLVFCRARITETRMEIERVVSELELPETGPSVGSDTDPWASENDES